MKFLAENWWYFLIVFAMAFMMFRKGGCCGSHSHQEASKINSGKNMNSCCKDKSSENKRE
ncbi:hypothetical protein OSC52_13100 [Clostridium pasteurianum]|uniref:hypothetical protein n=1 Tax=Clostridium pasteurianum TaxID=1501 RepID=UPI00117CB179|nr:hypothetical protein [Clostridium pasteurianum]UZW12788.1 hypothetical protein OSC52_13100 [Clostridium pasteurianum]